MGFENMEKLGVRTSSKYEGEKEIGANLRGANKCAGRNHFLRAKKLSTSENQEYTKLKSYR